MSNFWTKLNKPISCLAPMDDVTDTVFRQIVAKVARPDVFFTEFTNCDALFSPGREKHIYRLKYSKKEKPIVAQLWGINPDTFHKSALLVNKLGFSGIDINMGCPDRAVIKIGAGSALIENPDLAKEIISATKKGAGELPVSVKTRIGFKKTDTEKWCGFLLEQNIDALIIHVRTAKEKYLPVTHWDEIEKVVNIRDRMGVDTLIIGNGSIQNYSELVKKCDDYNLDGGMIGRGILSNISAFDKKDKELNKNQKLDLLKEHIGLWEKTWEGKRHFDILKKYFRTYISDYPGSKEFRMKLMKATNYKEAFSIIESSTDR